MTTPPRILTLRIEESEESIQGSLGDEAGASREFSGWLGFARALELILKEQPGAHQSASCSSMTPRPEASSIPSSEPEKLPKRWR
jgi:hypothetical protein